MGGVFYFVPELTIGAICNKIGEEKRREVTMNGYDRWS